MKYSKLFGKTIKEDPKDASIASHGLLLKAGYIKESVAGRYYFLPLGFRVRQKIVDIVREEMDNSGAQEILSPTLHPLELWEETNRTEAVNFELMKVDDRRDAHFALGGTAEEMFVDLMRKFQISYKDLPINIYQFGLKFRDEIRARGGLLRVREFLMKDAYSFDIDEKVFEKTYELMRTTYSKIFDRLGLKSHSVPADNGYIGGDYSHEFIVETDVGESTFLASEDGKYLAHEDIAEFKLDMVNADEELKDMEIIEQPDWVRTMEENVKHYKKDARHFLKNVVYRNFQGDIIIAAIRGDLEVNRTKLTNLLFETAELEDADDDDLRAIGTKSGYVHSWGHTFLEPRKAKNQDRECKVIYVADNSLKSVRNFIGGQKEETTDSVNVNYTRDFKHEIEGDIAVAKDGYLAPDGTSKLIQKVGVEVGHTFQLGYYYTNKMKGAEFINAEGKGEKYHMGCYGIGIGRTLQTIAEIHRDDHGLIWPMSVAPYHVHIVSIGTDKAPKKAEELYTQLKGENVEVLWDDRDLRPGEKLNDADLIGIPIRMVVGDKSLADGNVEIKMRNESETKNIAIDEVVEYVKGLAG